MEGYTPEAIVNREEPVPVIAVTGKGGPSNQDGPSDSKRKRDKLLSTLGGLKVKGKTQYAAAGRRESGHSLQDRFFTK